MRHASARGTRRAARRPGFETVTSGAFASQMAAMGRLARLVAAAGRPGFGTRRAPRGQQALPIKPAKGQPMLNPERASSESPHGGPPDSGGDLTIRDLFRFLSCWRGTISVSVALAIAVAAAYWLAATPIYTATAQILIETRLPPTFREQTPERLLPIDTPEVESQLGLLRSQRIAEKVVTQLGLMNDPDFVERKGWSGGELLAPVIARMRGAAGGSGARPVQGARSASEEAAERIREDSRAFRVGLSHIIEVTFSSPRPRQAADIANGLAEAYISEQRDARGEAARQGSLWLEARIDHLRKQMNTAALRVKEFRARRDYRIPQSAQAQPGLEGVAATDQGITLEELESQAETYRKIYESYLQAYAESVQRQSYPVANARVISRAAVPERKSHPRGLHLLAGALVIGMMAGVGLAFIRHSLRK